MNRHLLICVSMLLLLGISSCGKLKDGLPDCATDSEFASIIDDLGKVDESPFLPGTDKISIPQLSYYGDSGKQYTIQMDSLRSYIKAHDAAGILKNLTIVHTDTPAFIMPEMKSKIFAACISTRILKTDKNNAIQNKEDVVWIWNSLLNAPVIKSPKFILYSKGTTIANLEGTKQPPEHGLLPGKIYYFTVWTWDSAGIKISASGPYIPFMVHNLCLRLNNYSFIGQNESLKTWNLKSAKDSLTGTDITGSYPQTFVKFSYKCDGAAINYSYEDKNNTGAPVAMKIIEHAFFISNTSNDTLYPLFISPPEMTFYKNPGREHVILTYRN